MLQLKSLENIAIETLTETFNRAFSDYVVPFKLTKEGLLSKMKTDNVDLTYSVGAYLNDELVGFILHGSDIIDGKLTLYNTMVVQELCPQPEVRA